MALPVGTKAPEFTLKSKTATGLEDVSLSANLGSKHTLLLFFPLAFTGVCTQEMCDISNGLNGYAELGADVIGISVDSPFAQARSRSSSRASCCRTSPACRCWPTWPRCATSPRDGQGIPKTIEPLVPVDLVVDHSVMIDHYGSKDALDLNMKLEFQRNRERYQFMKWGMQAFDTFGVVPPGFGIVHQVNLEYLARGVHRADGVYYPDTLVGTDSHTTMINGIGVVGWGVGGIEAEAGMLGQPVYFLTPDVVGVNLTGQAARGRDRHRPGADRHRDAAQGQGGRQVRRVLRRRHATLPVPDRATIANMAPEYGATMGFFPVDEKTVAYFEGTGRTPAEIEASRPTSRRRACSACRRPGTSTTAGARRSTWDGRAVAGRAEAAAGPHRDRPREEAVRRCSQSRSRAVQRRRRRQRLQPAGRPSWRAARDVA
jgi:hypothetical protein